MVEPAPAPIDKQEFQFKLHSKLKLFKHTDETYCKPSLNLIASASLYGLVFVGTPDSKFEVIQLKSIEETSSKNEVNDVEKRSIHLPAKPTYLSLNCDQSLLAVAIIKECASVLIYGVESFMSQNVNLIREIRLSATPGVTVLETEWNPTVPSIYTACKSDGSLGIYDLKGNSVDINEIPSMAKVTCFCWSPKGKQVVVGSLNGSLTQYKPDLKAVKSIPPPTITGCGALSVVNVFWLTNYQFVAVYTDISKEESRPSIMIVNAPKTGNVTYINYEDICYSYGTLRAWQFYIIHQPSWGILLIASANSMEVGVLGISSSGEPAIWQQWNQIDAARAELPLSADQQETFPIGFAFDVGSTRQIPWGENQTLLPMPLIHVLSHHGVLCTFNVINLHQGAQTLCSPPKPITDISGLNQFKKEPLQIETHLKSMSSVQPVQSSTQNALSNLSTDNQQFVSSSTLPSFSPVLVTPVKPTPQMNTPTFFTSGNIFGAPSTQTATPVTFGGLGNQATFGAPGIVTSQPEKLQENFSSLTTTPPVFSGLTSSASNFSTSTSNTSNFNTATTTAINFVTPTSAVAPLFGTTSAAMNFSSLTSTAPNFGSLTSTAPIFGSNVPSKPELTIPTVKAPVFNLPSSATSSFGFQTSKPIAITPDQIQSIPPNTSVQNLSNVPVKPAVPSEDNKITTKLNTTNVVPKSSEISVVNDQEKTAISNKVIEDFINEEIKNFKLELDDLFKRCKNVNIDVGNDDEKKFFLITDLLGKFYKELQEITDSQVAEVHYLKQALIQSFAWYEDAKSRHRKYTDPQYASLLQLQSIDPVSEKRFNDIEHLLNYIKRQLKQANDFLDTEWADFQDSCKRNVKGKLKIPTLELIYQTLVNHNANIAKQRYILKDIGMRVKAKNKKSIPNLINVTFDDDTIIIENELSKLKINNVDIFKVRYDKIVMQEKKFTQTKHKKLCRYFSNRSVVHITPKKPVFSNSFLTPPKADISAQQVQSIQKAQKSLTPIFDQIGQNTENNSVEANLSASNVFAFPLPSNLNKSLTPERSVQPFKTDIQSIESESSSVFNFGSSKPAIFNFGAPVSFTQTKTQAESKPAMSFANNVKLNFGQDKSENLIQSKPAVASAPKTTSETTFPINFSVPKPIQPTSDKAPLNITFTGLNFGNVLGQSTPITKLSTQSTASVVSVTKTESLTSGFTKGMTTITPIVKSETYTSLAPVTTVSIFSQPISSSTTSNTISPQISIASSKPTTFNFDQSGATTATTLFGLMKTAVSPPLSVTSPSSSVLPKAMFDNTVISQPNAFSTTDANPLTKSIETVVTTVQSNIFGNISSPNSGFSLVTTLPESSVTFGQTNIFSGVSVPSVPGSIFGSKTTGTTFSSTTVSNSSSPVGAANSNVIFGSKTTTNTPTSTTLASTMFDSGSSSGVFSSTSAIIIPTPTVTSTTAITPVSTTVFETPFTINSNIFATSTTRTVTTTSSNIFGGSISASVNPTAVSTILSSPANTIQTFSNTSSPANIFGTPSTTANVFSPAQVTAASSAFTTVTSSETKNIFGRTISTGQEVSTTGLTSTTSVEPSSVTTSTSNIFTQSSAPSDILSNTPTTKSNIFGLATQTVFGIPTTTTPTTSVSSGLFSSTSNIFGGISSPATTSGFSFVQAAASTATSPVPVTTTTFGSPNFAFEPTTTKESTFGFNSMSMANDPNKFSFGNLTVSALSPNSNTSAPTTFDFGSPTTTTQATGFGSFGGGNIFQTATNTTASTFMGQPICSPSTFTQNTGSVFGQPGNIFAQKSSTPSTCSASIFGSNTNSVFGAPVATSSTPFGSNTGSIFGGSSTTVSNSSTPIFGQKPTGSIFGQSSFSTPTPSTGFGSSFSQNTGNTSNTGFAASGSIFGGKPTFGQAPAFGQSATFSNPPAFGSNPTSGNIFGSSTPVTQTSTFGGFGSPPAFQKQAFGSPPTFGQSAFGAQPNFGNPPTFGGQQRVFGAPSNTTGTFGPAVQENSTFANLANQNTLGFGSLAQNQAPPSPQQTSFTGSSSFSTWR